MTRGRDEIGSKDIFEKTGELPRTGFGELRPEELVLPAGGCSSRPAEEHYFSFSGFHWVGFRRKIELLVMVIIRKTNVASNVDQTYVGILGAS